MWSENVVYCYADCSPTNNTLLNANWEEMCGDAEERSVG
jgi:hypothetical protein